MTLGFGLGLRTKHYAHVLEHRPPIDWFEVVTENFLNAGGRPRRNLEAFRELYPLVTHGVGLSIASTDPISPNYLKSLHSLVKDLEPALVTDHLCWTRHHGQNSHDLLPVAYTRATLLHVKERVQQVQDLLKRRIYLENPSAYVSFAASEMDEAMFLRELCDLSGCGVLLDVNNLYVNSQNLGMDPFRYLDTIRGEDVCYFHLAGHTVLPDIRIDTHDEPVPAAVWDLYKQAARRFPHVPTLIEWDDNLPEFPGLVAELDKAREVHAAATAGLSIRSATSASYEPRVTVTERASTAAWAATQDAFWGLMVADRNVPRGDPTVEGLVDTSRPTRPERGMNAYVDAYFFRLADAIRDTYKALDNVIGASAFYKILRGFLPAHPPTEANIKYAARGLSGYLLTCDLPDNYGVPREVLRDLAALEWARVDVADEADAASPLGLGALGELQPDDWERVRFTFVNALRLVCTDYDVQPVIAAVYDGETPARPAVSPTAYLVSRPDLDAEVAIIEADAAALLAPMLAGATFLEACQTAAIAAGAELDGAFVSARIAFLTGWFQQGLVCGIELGDAPSD